MKALMLDRAGISINSDIANTTAGTELSIPKTDRPAFLAAQIIFTGTVTAVSIAIQISMDGTNWSTVYTSTTVGGEYINLGQICAQHIRAYHTSRTGGTNVLVQFLAQ